MSAPASATAVRSQLSKHEIFVRYVVFAIIASLANLGTQWQMAKIAPMVLSVLAGTGVGFLMKYVLERNWVFHDTYVSHQDEAGKFFLYGLSGVGTTLLFWGVEFGVWWIWHTEAARLAGGALGLAIGNWIKYQLDKNIVFRAAP